MALVLTLHPAVETYLGVKTQVHTERPRQEALLAFVIIKITFSKNHPPGFSRKSVFKGEKRKLKGWCADGVASITSLNSQVKKLFCYLPLALWVWLSLVFPVCLVYLRLNVKTMAGMLEQRGQMRSYGGCKQQCFLFFFLNGLIHLRKERTASVAWSHRPPCVDSEQGFRF